jgi:hypothetical protein
MKLEDRAIYGAREVNGLVDGPAYHAARRGAPTVDWTAPGLTITRLRLLSDPGCPVWDVSYCHGVLNGEDVDVRLPFNQLPKHQTRAAIVAHARRAKVYALELGILTNISTLE